MLSWQKSFQFQIYNHLLLHGAFFWGIHLLPKWTFLLYAAMIKWKLTNCNLFDRINANFQKWFFFVFFIITLIKMKSRRHTVPIWKELNVFNTHILVWSKNLQNCRHSTKKYQYKKFLLRLYVGRKCARFGHHV